MLIKEKQKEVWVRFENRTAYFEKEVKFLECLREYPGEYQVVVYLEQEKAKRKLHQRVNDAALIELKELFGINNVTETPLMNSITARELQSEPEPSPLERIADALEAISRTLDSIDQSLDLLSDSVSSAIVKNAYGSSISVTGTIMTE